VQDNRIDRQDQSKSDSSGVHVSEVILPDLLPTKGSKSAVWYHFGLRHEDGRPIEIDKPVCKLCFSNVSAKDGNTSNLYAHLKNKHPEEYTATKMKASKLKKRSNIRNPDQPTICDSFLQSQSCQPVIMNTSGLPGVLLIGWL